MRRRLFLLVAAMTALGVSCSGGSQDVGDVAADTDPCALLDADAIAQVTGWDMPDGVRPTEQEQDGQLVCHWETAELTGLVQVQVHPGAGEELFTERRAELESEHALDPATDVDVPGATAAYEQPAHGLVGMLAGDHFVQVVTFGAPLDDAQHLELAEVVAGRAA